jgi:hypothetical protein
MVVVLPLFCAAAGKASTIKGNAAIEMSL